MIQIHTGVSSLMLLPALALAAALAPAYASAQSQDRNYVLSRHMLDSSGSSFIEELRYHDGLGRPVLTCESSGPGSYVCELSEYGHGGSLSSTYIPVPGDGSFMTSSQVSSSGQTLYPGETRLKRTYSTDMLDRPVTETGPGALWEQGGHSVTRTYGTNSGGEVRLYGLSGQSLVLSGYYAAGSLRTVTETDEDGLTRTIYADFQGRVVMTRDNAGGETYYVLDDWGEPQMVIPPAASASMSSGGPWSLTAPGAVRQWCYVYGYDERHRRTSVLLPGCEAATTCYDTADRPVFTQDGAQASVGRCAFTLYDPLGRPAVSGTCPSSCMAPVSSSMSTVSYMGASNLGGYTCQMSLQDVDLLTVTWYDSYGFLSILSDDSLSFAPVTGHTGQAACATGLVTGQASYSADGGGTPLLTVCYYDTEGRIIQQRSSNTLGGHDVTATSYTFSGEPSVITNMHSAPGKPSLCETSVYSYDSHSGLLTSVTHSVNGSSPVTLSSYTYDAVGRVSTKTVGGLETTSYTYNVRSWPTRISGQRFTERLCYNTTVDGLNPILPHQYCWSGRVGAYAWQCSGETRQRGYGLVYDDQGRLISANYGEGTFLGNYMGLYEEKAEYDDMGNPTWVYRKSPNSLNGSRTSSPSDRLRLEYDGNQLVHVTDSVATGHTYAGAFHFADGADEAVEYEYDENGNMTKDLNRKISSVEYNLLNLPSMIEFEDHSFIRNTYSAAGEKLSTSYGIRFAPVVSPLSAGNAGGETPQGGIVIPGDGGIPGDDPGDPEPQAGQFRYYCGDVVYDMGTTRLLTDEGYVTFSSDGTPQYHYYLRDHLGNVRVVFDQTDAVEQVNHYYAFGGLMRESTNPGVQPYKYGSKELDRTGGLDAYDFGARSYFADRLQWGTMDPLCEKYYDVTPYGYCLNDPVNAIDLHGDSITIFDMASIDAIYNALQKGTNLSMKFTNGVLVPESIQQIASNSQDSFLQDLYNISINPQMVEIATTYINDYYIGNQYHFDTWSVPTETDYAKDHNRGQEDLLHPSGLTLVGNLGQTLYPISSDEYKRSTNNNIRININALGSINQRSCGIAHEFGHVILYLSRKPHSHSQNGDFIYGRQWNVMKRFGYDYLESSTGKIFR